MAESAYWRRQTTLAARRAGIPAWVFRRQIRQESGFDPSARSPAGALGIAQIMPATARGWGVDPMRPRQALNAAAHNMAGYIRQFGNVEDALRAYNAGPGAVKASHGYSETNHYVDTILNGRNPGRGSVGRGGGGGSSRMAGGAAPLPGDLTVPGVRGAGSLPMGSEGLVSLLKTLTAKPAPSGGSQLPTPGFAAGPALPAGAQQVQSSGGPAPKADTQALLDVIRTVGGDVQNAPGTGAFTIPGAGGGGLPGADAVAGRAPGRSKVGRVVIDPNADRPGVRTHRDVIQFVRGIAGRSGQTLRIGTGTRHSQYTVNGTVSDHWRGEGADVPLAGKALVRAGQAALIEAGMDPAKARRISGGGFNVGGWQIIFNTNAAGWGDHTTHLHVGRRRR